MLPWKQNYRIVENLLMIDGFCCDPWEQIVQSVSKVYIQNVD